MQHMQTNMRDTLSHQAHSATELVSAAEEMTAVMQQSATGLQQQNSEIETAATAVTKMCRAVEESAGKANFTLPNPARRPTTVAMGNSAELDTNAVGFRK